jgi:polyphosphate glucokinase
MTDDVDRLDPSRPTRPEWPDEPAAAAEGEQQVADGTVPPESDARRAATAAWLTEMVGAPEDPAAPPSTPQAHAETPPAAGPIASESLSGEAIAALLGAIPRELPPDDDPLLPPPRLRLSGLALGIDVGGTGVKAALVDLSTAELVSDRIRERTPQPATPEAITETIVHVAERALAHRDVSRDLPVGCGLPGVVKAGRLTSAANIDESWIGWPAEERISAALGRHVLIINDADAAGLAEMAYGAGIGRNGTVLLLTIGTGIGSALFIDGRLVPNTELGHLELHGRDAETLVSGAARERRKLGWKAWARQFGVYLKQIERYFSPDLFIFGGGVSKEWARWGRFVDVKAEVVTAQFLNTSGIIGAGYAAAAAARRLARAGASTLSGVGSGIGAATGVGAGTVADTRS